MADLVNTFEGGTHGDPITVANSGGASGDPLSNTNVAGTNTLTFDNAHAAHGGLAAKHVWDGSAAANHYRQDQAADVTVMYQRIYLWADAAPPQATAVIFLRDSGGTQLAFVRFLVAGTLRLFNSAGTAVATSANNVALGQWVRIEMMADTAGNLEARLFNDAESTTPTDTLTGTQAAPATQLRQAQISSTVAVPNTWTIWTDSIKQSTDGWPGPYTVTPGGDVTRLAPDAILAQTNSTGAVAAIQDDPDAPDPNSLPA